MDIRLIKASEVEKLHDLIAYTCRKTWTNYYPKQSIEFVIDDEFSISKLQDLIANSHFYVAIENDILIGCGAITNINYSSACLIRTVFVNPNYQNVGIGRAIMTALESDSYTHLAKKIELSSSIMGIPFYKKLGYEHKNNVLNYKDGQFMLEKIINLSY